MKRTWLERAWRTLVHGGRGSLREYEQAALGCFREALPEGAPSILDAQLQAVEQIQRFSDDKLVVFHFGELADGQLFPNRSEELRASRVRLRAGDVSVACDVVLHQGRLSSLELRRSPRGLRDHDVRCEEVRILADVLTAGIPDEEAPARAIPLALEGFDEVTHLLAPAPHAEIARFEAELEGAAPSDYRALLRQTNGFTAGGWTVLGTRARRIVLPGGNYRILAERNDSAAAIAAVEGAGEPKLVYYDEIADSIRPLGKDLLPALRAVVREASGTR